MSLITDFFGEENASEPFSLTLTMRRVVRNVIRAIYKAGQRLEFAGDEKFVVKQYFCRGCGRYF